MGISISLSAQERPYYTYESSVGGFSFMCPTSWICISDSLKNQDDYSHTEKELLSGRFITIDTTEATEYSDCYDGVIFYITVTRQSLDSALSGLYVKKDNKYYGDFAYMSNELVETTNIEGSNWIGINHYNTCKIHCKSDDVSPIVEGCQFLYFSNDKITVNFSTTGRELDDKVLKTILRTFKFHE